MEVEPKPHATHRGRIIASVVGGIATALSLVIGFIAILPILTQSSSGLDKLGVRVEVYRPDELSTYLVPVSVPLTSFPLSENESCTAEQRTWLDANGVAFQSYYLVTITNMATSGGVLGFGSISSNGSKLAPSQPAIVVECDPTAASQPRIAPARLDVSGDQVAYYDRSRLGVDNSTPDTPLIYNLQPGESGQFVLQLVSSDDFSGGVDYTATSGTDTARDTLELGPLSIPGTSPIAPRAIQPNDPFWACIAGRDAIDCAANP